MKKLIAVAAVFILVAASVPIPAHAHVLFVDQKTNIAAVFHSNPDDDPIAGEQSELYFDIQDTNSTIRIPYDGYNLIITDEQNNAVTVPVSASGTTAMAKYTFPAQGLYKLSLASQPKYDAFQKVTINGSLRVNRGVGVSTVKKSITLPTLLLVGTLTLLALVGITFSNNRKTILKKSVF